MRGLILAAGRGSRLGSLTDEFPKCFTRLGDKILIDWQIEAFQHAGINELGVVTGYQAHCLDFPVWKVKFHNSNWSQTNMVMSLACASDWLSQEPCIISYSDIIYSPEHLKTLIQADGDIVITYDKKWQQLWQARFQDPLSDAETFQINSEGYLIEIGNRAQTLDEIGGQYMGLIKLSPLGWQAIAEYLSSIPPIAQNKLDMTKLLQNLIKTEHLIQTVAVEGDWLEVDTVRDLELYSSNLHKYIQWS